MFGWLITIQKSSFSSPSSSSLPDKISTVNMLNLWLLRCSNFFSPFFFGWTKIGTSGATASTLISISRCSSDGDDSRTTVSLMGGCDSIISSCCCCGFLPPLFFFVVPFGRPLPLFIGVSSILFDDDDHVHKCLHVWLCFVKRVRIHTHLWIASAYYVFK